MAETTKGRSGCRKAAIWTGLGCLAIPAIGLIIALVSLTTGLLFYNHEGPPTPQTTTLSLPAGAGEAGAPAGSGTAAPEGGEGTEGGIRPGVDFEQLQQARRSQPPVRLVLDFQEGRFEIRPGPPGSRIEVEGVFDPRDYELSQEIEEGSGDYDQEVTVTFRRKVPLLFMLLKGGFDHSQDTNRVVVRIPEDLPTALELRVSKGESDTDLGGLTLTALKADLTMGEHNLAVSRPIHGELERVELRQSMGEVNFTRLGNLRSRQISLRGRMGELDVDLGGDWPAGFSTRADVTFSMGECRLLIPAGIRISPNSSSTIFLGESRTGALDEEGSEDPGAPVLELHASARMGELSVSRE